MHAQPQAPALTQGCRIGIDVGGTFTDFVLADAETGEITIYKEPSVPSDPSASVERGLPQLLARAGRKPEDVQLIVHGTTIGLNAIIQRRGAKMGMVVSPNMRGILEIGRSQMPDAFSFLVPKETPLVPRRLILESGTRILNDGSVEGETSDEEIAAMAETFRTAGVEAVAIVLIHGYRRIDVERDLAARLAAHLPGVAITASASVWPEQREYERGMIALMNAYVQPIMTSYLDRLERRVQGLDIAAPIYITANNGGTLGLKTAAERPIDTLLSGPASGVVAAAVSARASGVAEILTVDMGGTSADMSVITDGEPETTNRTQIGDFPIILPVVNVNAIGAGGGSIVWVDAHGVMKIGPTSAGADPGPVCYGRGGTAPTVTDCFLVSGFIDPDRFVGGRMQLDIAAARAALDLIGDKIGLAAGPDRAAAAAAAALRVTTAKMVAEMAKGIAQRGLDLRSFTLLPFGGAGPTLANFIAEEAGLKQMLVPARPGTFCALGAIMADVKRDYVRTAQLDLTADKTAGAQIHATLTALAEDAAAWIAGEGDMLAGHDFTVTCDMRYHGQAFDLPVSVAWGPLGVAGDDLIEGLHREHERLYQYRDLDTPVEVTAIRLRVTGHVTPIGSVGTVPATRAATAPTAESRRMFWNNVIHDAPVVKRADMVAGTEITGPLIVEQEDTTTVVLPGWSALFQANGNLILTKQTSA